MFHNGKYSLPWKPILFSSDIAEIWHTNGHIRQKCTVFFREFLEYFSGFYLRFNIRYGTFTVKFQILTYFS